LGGNHKAAPETFCCGKSVLGLSIIRLLQEDVIFKGDILYRGENLYLIEKEDMRYKTTLKHAFDDVTFDLDNNNYYTSHGNHILKCNYENNDILGYYNTNSIITYLFFNNHNVIAIGIDDLGKHYIEVIKE